MLWLVPEPQSRVPASSCHEAANCTPRRTTHASCPFQHRIRAAWHTQRRILCDRGLGILGPAGASLVAGRVSAHVRPSTSDTSTAAAQTPSGAADSPAVRLSAARPDAPFVVSQMQCRSVHGILALRRLRLLCCYSLRVLLTTSPAAPRSPGSRLGLAAAPLLLLAHPRHGHNPCTDRNPLLHIPTRHRPTTASDVCFSVLFLPSSSLFPFICIYIPTHETNDERFDTPRIKTDITWGGQTAGETPEP